MKSSEIKRECDREIETNLSRKGARDLVQDGIQAIKKKGRINGKGIALKIGDSALKINRLHRQRMAESKFIRSISKSWRVG